MLALTAGFVRGFAQKKAKSRFLIKIYSWGPSQLRTFLFPSTLYGLLIGANAVAVGVVVHSLTSPPQRSMGSRRACCTAVLVVVCSLSAPPQHD